MRQTKREKKRGTQIKRDSEKEREINGERKRV